MNNTTIVTSLLYTGINEKIEYIIEQYLNIIDLFPYINVCLYTTSEYEETVKLKTIKYSNIKIMDIISVDNSWISRTCSEIDYELPSNRNELKDTSDFIISGHIKHELLLDAIDKNPWNSNYFIWMDSTIFEIVKKKEETKEYFHWLSKLTLSESFISFPGCWSKLEKDKESDVLNTVHWRFCGGFLIGDKTSVNNFCNLYKKHFPDFLKKHGKLVWDFNFWSWMETFILTDENKECDFGWYKADHNDNIFMISADTYTHPIKNIIEKKEYNYPKIDTYYPTSASYLYYKYKHWINTRYVNYWIYPNGCYLFNNPTKLIENKNMLSHLDSETMEPLFYKEVEENISLPYVPAISKGLEDIRLYTYNDTVKYVATTSGYSENGKSRMIIGNYDIDKSCICDGVVISPPKSNHDSWCEKNWIPIIQRKKYIVTDGIYMDNEEELFIYKWFPMEIGKINYTTNALEIVKTHQIKNPIFSKIRGSTLFYETIGGLIGVVHYSEDHSPRHYYHMLVLLDKETLEPLIYTEPFCFEKLGIEFCIGFKIIGEMESIHIEKNREPWDEETENNYIFWISRHDRDPLMIKVNTEEIKWII